MEDLELRPAGYDVYVQELRQLVAATHMLPDGLAAAPLAAVHAALDGQASARLRELVPYEHRRAQGAFFTGSQLARRLIDAISPSFGPESVVLDPTCGAGSLLLPALAPLAGAGVTDWGTAVRGFDTNDAFVNAAQLRMQLALELLTGDQGFAVTGLRRADALASTHEAAAATHILMNPPFTTMPSPPGCTWTRGGVNAAAVFVEAYVEAARPGTIMAAVLPDVLRSGSRYEGWRARIGERADTLRTETVGRFDEFTNVDVFCLYLTRGSRSAAAEEEPLGVGASLREDGWRAAGGSAGASRTLADDFEVSVGAVVDNRHARTGPSRPFAVARDLPARTEVATPSRRREFSGRVHQPPFVLVRRTSSPKDAERLAPTLVTGPDPVAVDNHLLVLTPRDGSLVRCRALMSSLDESEVRTWLDQRIRCRHLTVKALRELPLHR